jgi:hypothetical protein
MHPPANLAGMRPPARAPHAVPARVSRVSELHEIMRLDWFALTSSWRRGAANAVEIDETGAMVGIAGEITDSETGAADAAIAIVNCGAGASCATGAEV